MLNVPALEQALDEIVNRHEILRTRIVEIDGQPLQEILPNVTVELRVLDLSHLPQDQAEAEVRTAFSRGCAPTLQSCRGAAHAGEAVAA